MEFTNRDLLKKAMPMSSLSKTQWEKIISLMEEVQDPELYHTLETITSNQAKLEVVNNYMNYFKDAINKTVINDGISRIMTI